MKKSIALAALLLGLGTSVFAFPKKPGAEKAEAPVSFSSLEKDNGFGVKVGAEKSVMIVYDSNNNVIFKDLITKGLPTEKGYVITGLENGDYTVEVASGKSAVKKQLHVYNDGMQKSYIFIQ
ncbi:MAG TPA: hypothetical protein VHC47_13390 [Mucilaginibacter sp.]|nr:hypothetical protein [Mucilaginibacter sp.]